MAGSDKLDRRERRWRGLERLDREPTGPRVRCMVALVLACLTLITLDYRGGADSPVEPARRAVGEVFGPVETGTTAAIRPPVHRGAGLVPLAATPCSDDIARLAGRELPAALRGRDRRLRPQPARGVRRPHRRRRRPRLRAGAGPRRRPRPGAVLLAHRDHRRRLRRRPAPRHDRAQQRRPGRPGPAGHPHDRDRAADRRHRVGRRRPGRREHGGRLPARPGRPRRATAASTSSWSTSPRCPAKGDTVVTWGSEGGAPYVSGVPVGTRHQRLHQPARDLPARGDRPVRRLRRPSTWSAWWCRPAPPATGP